MSSAAFPGREVIGDALEAIAAMAALDPIVAVVPRVVDNYPGIVVVGQSLGIVVDNYPGIAAGVVDNPAVIAALGCMEEQFLPIVVPSLPAAAVLPRVSFLRTIPAQLQ